jgi:hypothetical protein
MQRTDHHINTAQTHVRIPPLLTVWLCASIDAQVNVVNMCQCRSMQVNAGSTQGQHRVNAALT